MNWYKMGSENLVDEVKEKERIKKLLQNGL